MRDENTITRAKRERREPTAAEARLWSALRDRRYRAFKTRRQHAIGPYVADFACVSMRLIIEVDGASHDQPEQVAFDAQRTAFLENAGWRVVRLRNHDVMAGGDSLVQKLDSLLRD